MNNYIINTNVEAIKASEGRRYYILDLSTQYKNKHEYFNKLYDTCVLLQLNRQQRAEEHAFPYSLNRCEN
jgi:hypothetical protein